MIEKVIKAMMEKNYNALASFFSEDCEYIDYCPCLYGGGNHCICGTEGVAIFFRYTFISGGMEIAQPLIKDDMSATCFNTYGGPYVYSLFSIEELDSSGLIRKLVVRPA